MHPARVLFALGVALGASSAHASPASNPPFLGIEMATQVGTCRVERVIEGGSAEAAGLKSNDRILAIEGVPMPSCNEVSGQIVAHQAGDTIRLDVQRGSEHVVIEATLSSRAEILYRKFVGHALGSIEAIDYDNQHDFDLADARAQTTVLAWFDAGCVGCDQVIRKVASRLAHHAGQKLIAVTHGSLKELAAYRLDVGAPIAVVDELYFVNTGVFERERIYFMILDGHGVVRFVMPVAPDSDDLDPALDEVLAAAAQAEHVRARR
jgi:hypothetical protein